MISTLIPTSNDSPAVPPELQDVAAFVAPVPFSSDEAGVCHRQTIPTTPQEDARWKGPLIQQELTQRQSF